MWRVLRRGYYIITNTNGKLQDELSPQQLVIIVDHGSPSPIILRHFHGLYSTSNRPSNQTNHFCMADLWVWNTANTLQSKINFTTSYLLNFCSYFGYLWSKFQYNTLFWSIPVIMTDIMTAILSKQFTFVNDWFLV